MGVRVGFVLAFAVATDMAHAGQWEYEHSVDKMTGKTQSFASIRSDNSLRLDFPYSGTNHGTAVVRRHPKYGLDVYIQIDKGQILCRSYQPCKISVRFGDGKPFTLTGSGSSDNDTTVVFVSPTKRFIDEAKKNKSFLVQVPLYRGGEQILEFSTKTTLVW